MTRKDFVLIARVVAQLETLVVRQFVAKLVVEEAVKTNPEFDREKFRKACRL